MKWRRLRSTAIDLRSPNTARYRTLFNGMRADDLVLHYLTTSLTTERRLQSSMVGVSRVTSRPAMTSKTIIAPCADTLEFSDPVHYPELRELAPKDGALKQLIGMRMQRYLTQVRENDFVAVIEARSTNSRLFQSSSLRGYLTS